MPVAVTGSIATDHLMTFPGKFTEQFVEGQMENVSLSFLVDDLVQHRGGAGANMAYGLGLLGLQPVLVGAVGSDFAEYDAWLTRHGVDTRSVHWSELKHTARFVCTTDAALAQIATFYTGAMSEARDIDLATFGDDFDLVLVGPDDPEGMQRHTRSCRDRGIAFAADPSQQLAWADGELIRDLIDGAAYLFSNDYEAALIEQKSGWTAADVQSHVGTRVVTRGKDGVSVYPADGPSVEVKAIEGVVAVDPTGVGDSFRAGFLAGVAAELDLERSAQIGCTIAASVVETKGTQEYELTRDGFLKRLGAAYGDTAAADVDAALKLA